MNAGQKQNISKRSLKLVVSENDFGQSKVQQMAMIPKIGGFLLKTTFDLCRWQYLHSAAQRRKRHRWGKIMGSP